jgi:enterochelin esterase-like enzyme
MRTPSPPFTLALCVALGARGSAVFVAPQHGSVSVHTVPTKQYSRPRLAWVYTPPNYPESCGAGCPLVVAFDGAVYIGAIALPTILDSLTAARKIAPTVALLIDNGASSDRLADLANHKSFATFVGDEVIPWVREKWRVTNDPARTIITGSSAGGLASAYLAFERPDLFGNVLSQSGAFWRGNEGSNGAPYEWVAAQYAAVARKSVRFFLDVGATETRGAMGGAAPSILAANRRLRDVLREKGYFVEYFEVPNGEHAPESWRVRLPIGLTALAPVERPK